MPFLENKTGGLCFMTASNISATHAFTTRMGGVSRGIYESLNLGQNVGDDPACVRQNYQKLGEALGFDPDRIIFSRQVHGTDIRVAVKDDACPPFTAIPYEADGLITIEKDIPLVIFTADCVPILLFDPVRGAIGAVHAGWRGTTADIAGTAVRKMTDAFGCSPSDIRAAIGPCISSCCYETDRDVRNAVVSVVGNDTKRYAKAIGEKYMVDLKGINRLLLERAGIAGHHIEVSEDCTSCLCEKYWSHRVTKGKRGSQATVIMMKGQTL